MNLVTQEIVNDLILNSEIVCQTRLGKITVVTLVLPNGFTITESSASVNTENYDYQYGIKVCMKKIEDEIWKLEAYRLMAQEYERRMNEATQAPEVTEAPEAESEVIQEGEAHV